MMTSFLPQLERGKPIFSRVHVPLQPALSVGRGVGWSVCHTLFFFMILFLWPHCSCPNGLVTSNMAPAHPHAILVAVYPALFFSILQHREDAWWKCCSWRVAELQRRTNKISGELWDDGHTRTRWVLIYDFESVSVAQLKLENDFRGYKLRIQSV